jgi:phenylpropionate dioxygenase-like ring-hydroxylating dioxygenase large terminal subunit
LLGERLIVVRLGGEVVCLRDLCIHMGTPLSLGLVEGDCLVCAHHGWAFARDGSCVRIPSLPPDYAVPKKVRVDSFQCTEKNGMVWVCLNAEPRADVPDLDEYTDPAWTYYLIGPYTWKCSAARAMENFVDMAHFPWVHEGILGDRDHTQTAEVTIERVGEELRYQFGDLPNSIHPVEHIRRYRLYRPFTIYQRKDRVGSDEAEVLFWTLTPHGANACTNFLYVMRNYPLTPEEERERIAMSEIIATQDRPIVESQRPEELPLDLSQEMHIKGPDSVAVEYRRIMAELGVSC